ncbi:hypothetical protein HDV04_005940 [Boothiomyces sp. JEL0838]|nr:hypothetical protein HDV04_005940 [Boothiomyces sp. JEL0838]
MSDLMLNIKEAIKELKQSQKAHSQKPTHILLKLLLKRLVIVEQVLANPKYNGALNNPIFVQELNSLITQVHKYIVVYNRQKGLVKKIRRGDDKILEGFNQRLYNCIIGQTVF